ncbi:MAG: UDP-2,3-diacylglucosamine diphosphatase [Rhodospirillaceae bacterium]|nr:UDP-2,3-diacylglucosamine diphosphatase [Rhodospirillaceae bacterium]
MRSVGTSLKFRSIFISDIHLGTRGCKAEFLLDFLKHTESERLYLVGDIVDGWRLKRNWFWLQAHNDVVQKVLRKARKGTDVVYVPGNHDEFLRDYLGHEFGQIRVRRNVVHKAADGKRYLVIHGDECDGVMIYARWLAVLGDYAYVTALAVNHWFNVARRVLGLPYWSLSKYLKHKVKNAVQFISNYEGAMANMARTRGTDGVICGHIHHAAIKDIDGVRYCNDGDWVESCTALVEHFDGRMEIIAWADLRGLVPGATAPLGLPAPLAARAAGEADAAATAAPGPVHKPKTARVPLEAFNKAIECEYSSSPTPGTPKSTVSSEP